MNQTKNTAKVWYTVSAEKLIAKLKMPKVAEAYLADLCRYDSQTVANAALDCAGTDIRGSGANVLLLAAIKPTLAGDNGVECIVVLGGEPEELKKVVGFGKPFEWMDNPLEHEDPSHYEKIRESAFNLLRKQNVKNLSDEEIWRAVKHSGNAGLYTAILRREIADGFTIKKLRAQDRGMER